jgi:hypothetical protein
MNKTLAPVGASGWLLANLAAMGFSLMHAIADLGVIFGSAPSRLEVQQSVLTVIIGLMYTWWAWVLVRAVRGTRSGLVGLIAFDVLWVGLNGVTIIFCLPPCGTALPFYGDAIHLGTLIFGPLAAYLAYRAVGPAPVRSSRLAMAGNIVVMVAFLAGIFAVLGWVASAAQGAF